jgi:transposase
MAALAKYPTIIAVSADAGYGRTTEAYLAEASDVVVEISRKIKDSWVILKKRWGVERTFSWINNYRRLSKNLFIISLIRRENGCFARTEAIVVLNIHELRQRRKTAVRNK